MKNVRCESACSAFESGKLQSYAVTCHHAERSIALEAPVRLLTDVKSNRQTSGPDNAGRETSRAKFAKRFAGRLCPQHQHRPSTFATLHPPDMLTEAIRRIFCVSRSSRQPEATTQPDEQDAPTPTNDAHSASNGVPPNTLAVGSVWDNFESLMQAMCEESRKQTDTPLCVSLSPGMSKETRDVAAGELYLRTPRAVSELSEFLHAAVLESHYPAKLGAGSK